MKFLKNTLAVILLIVVSTFFMKDLAKPGLPKLHDSNPHMSRMIAFDAALSDGQYPPMWSKEMFGGIGSPVMMLNYQLPYFVSQGFVKAGFSYFDSYKLTLGMSFILSGLLMYFVLASKYGAMAGLIGAFIYTLAPYRFVDIYVRGALGESLMFIFPPLLLWGFTRSSLPLLIVGWAGLFLTHPLASAALSGFFLGYTLLVGEKEQIGKQVKLFFTSYGVALLIASFNLIPTLALTKYTYYSPNLSGTLQMFPTLNQLIDSKWGYGDSTPGDNDGMSFELGIVQWGVLIAGAISLLKNRSKEMRYLVGISIVCLLFILPISTPVYKLLNLMAIIDFPWRLLLCLVFGTAWIGAMLIQSISQPKVKYVISGIVISVLLSVAIPIAKTGSYWERDIAWFSRETGDSHGEYAPRTRSSKHSAPFGKRAEPILGNAEIEQTVNQTNRQSFEVKVDELSVIRINTNYFPGWKVFIDNQEVAIDSRQNDESKQSTCFVTTRTLEHIDDSGLFACHLQPGLHTLEIKYVMTTVQRLGNLLTLAGIGVYLWILLRLSYLPIMKRKQ
jgi:hypothetical protein